MVSAVAGVGGSNNISGKGKALAEKKFLKKGQGRAAVPLDKYKSNETAEAAAGAAGAARLLSVEHIHAMYNTYIYGSSCRCCRWARQNRQEDVQQVRRTDRKTVVSESGLLGADAC